MIDQRFLDDLAQDLVIPKENEQAPDVQLASANTGVTTDGGAFVGYRMNMPKGLNTPENMAKQSVLIADTMAGGGKGAMQGFVGLPGDLESIGRMALNYLGYNVDENTALPTSEEIGKRLESVLGPVVPQGQTTGVSTEERVRAAEGGELGGEILAPGGQVKLASKVAKPVLKATGEIIKAGKDLPVGMSIKMVDGTDAVVPKAPQINTPEFNNWFGGSKVVDDSGVPIAVYHGTGRPDRVGEQFRKSRATSGPMSFFTDNPEVASGYAKGKTDTSIAYEDDAFDYKNWFKKKVGRENLNLEQVGARMSPQERNSVIEKLRDITVDEDTGEIVYKQGGGSIMVDSAFDWYLNQESKGNPLVLANKIWLESGQLYGKEEEFAKVLNLAGVKGFDYNDPHAKFPFVYKVFLSIKNPLDTSNIGEDVIQSLEQASKRVRKPTQSGGADNWDKNTVDPKVWIERLKSDQAEGTTHAWTSIPDWVTKTLKAKGFDGIKDSGGKGGGTNHNVWIPFEENQVKSALGNKGTFSESKNIMRGVGVGGTGTAMSQEENK
jgi:ADP-Ribosyltransferase in polyvalent proteins